MRFQILLRRLRPFLRSRDYRAALSAGEGCRDRCLAAVAALPELPRAVFGRHRIDGQALAEIAEALNLPGAELESLLAGALVAIGDALDWSS